MILEDHLSGIIQSGAYGSQLYQNLGAIIAVLYHAFYFFQMANGSCEAVDNCLLVFVYMSVRMRNAVGMHIGVVMLVFMVVIMLVSMIV